MVTLATVMEQVVVWAVRGTARWGRRSNYVQELGTGTAAERLESFRTKPQRLPNPSVSGCLSREIIRKIIPKSSKMVQNSPQIVAKWSKMVQNGPKWFPKWFQNGPKWSQNGPKMTPKWPKNGPKMVPKWSQNGRFSGPKMV